MPRKTCWCGHGSYLVYESPTVEMLEAAMARTESLAREGLEPDRELLEDLEAQASARYAFVCSYCGTFEVL